jgi:integrase
VPKLRGPRKRPKGGPNWYACLTVPKALRQRAGKSELWRSLGTSDPSLASKLYGAAIEALEAQLAALVAEPALAEQVERNRGPVTFGIPVERDGQRTWIEHEEEDPALVAETLTYDRTDKEITQPLVYEALKKRERMAMTWEELRDFYAKTRLNKKGQALSDAALFEVNKGIELMRQQAPYPDLLTVRHCRDIYKSLINSGSLKPRTIMSRLGMAKTMIKTGIKHEALKLTVNPWEPVDFIVESRPEDSYRPFSKEEVQKLFSITDNPEIWYVLFGTALRIGEFWSREASHLDGLMLVVTPTKKQNGRLKTATSYRRIPLNQKAVLGLNNLLPFKTAKCTLQRLLQKDLNQLPTRDDKLVIHSTRHTWKTWSRRVGIPVDVSDEIDGHKKKITTDVSDGYGIYPDELLIEQNNKVWNFLDDLIS